MENWVDVCGYEGYYMISDLGNVYSKRKHRNMKPQAGGRNGEGYLQIGFSDKNGKTLYSLHKVLAEHFIPNPENKPVVNHKDGNKKNNTLDNLEWATHSENQQHAYKTGLNKALKKGEEHYKHKLTENDVKEIRRLYSTGMYSQRKLAEMYKINQTNVGFIVRMETWKDV